MLVEVLESLSLAPGQTIVDGTLGGGGHSRPICDRIAPGGMLIGLDRDQDALDAATLALSDVPETVAVKFVRSNYADIATALNGVGIEAVDGVLLDLGVSSHQLNTPERGFALRYVGPLDMRMDVSSGQTAADLLNTLPEAEIARILFEYGEEPRARRIAAEIVRRRATRPLITTEDLVDTLRATMPFRTRPGEIHPATKTFQAIRIAVNQELDAIETALRAATNALKPGGRLVVIAYHSLEDRIVKNTMAELSGKRVETDFPSTPLPKIVEVKTKKPLTPTEEEIRANPRARSAKMRVAERRP
jgi:16S rRNA (cytosine1402-N4)-methyltransferase